MSDIAIKVEDVSKLYQLGTIGTGTLSRDLSRWYAKMRGKEDPFAKIGQVNDRTKKADSDFVWALKDINFEVKKGEVLGIIGRNGAGKSTLLKILSKITAPTTGKIIIDGRIASLLEVGTGFHPEMTGRENIFMNGAILGMRKWEIKKKFDEIVDFAGVEAYIDTPVKRYSSGMYVRLAFAVAAFLEPEILIVDEVLAVGDAEFQKKCLGRMKDVSKNDGRTVLFVSHNMAAVNTLCNRAILLENGILKLNDTTAQVVKYYLSGDKDDKANQKSFHELRVEGIFSLNNILISNTNSSIDKPVVENLPIEIVTKIFVETDQPERYHLTYHLINEHGEALFSFSNSPDTEIQKGRNTFKCLVPANFLQAGNYSLNLFFIEDKRQAVFIEKDIFSFTIVDAGRELGMYMGREPGYIRPYFKWQMTDCD